MAIFPRPIDTRSESQKNGSVKSYHSIDKFLTHVRSFDLVRSDRFEVMFELPTIMPSHKTSQGNSPTIVSLLAEDVTFPGLLIGSKPLRLNNLSEQRANLIDFGGDSITFSFLVDTAWTSKDMFGDWMRNIINPTTRYVTYPQEYYSTIDIVSLNKQDEVIAQWKVIDAFPRSIAPITVSSSNSEVLRLSVTFAYKSWEVVGGYNSFGQPLEY